MSATVKGNGTPDDPWTLQTPSLQSEFQMVRDPEAEPPARDRGSRHDAEHGDWMPLGNADEQKPAKEGTVEAWARDPDNPVGGWYGLKKDLRGRFGNYVPPRARGDGARRGRAQRP